MDTDNHKVSENRGRDITKPALARLARRAGVKRISGDAYEELRKRLKKHLEDIIKIALIFKNNEKCKTLMLRHLLLAYQSMGRYILPKLHCTKQTVPEIRYSRYIIAVLKQVHPDAGISSVAALQLEYFVGILSQIIAIECARLLKSSGIKTLSPNCVVNAVGIVMPGELTKHAISQATQAWITYDKSKGNSDEKTSTTKASAAGLIFPPARAEKVLRRYVERISGNTAVAFAAVLEYICTEILQLAGNVAKESKLTRIQTRHIHIAVQKDDELQELFRKHNIILLGGGVVPYIHQELLKKSKRSKPVTKNTDASKKDHKWRPGTQAVREIKRYQKSSNTLVHKLPFERVFRKILAESEQDCLVSRPVLDVVQMESEKYLINILNKTNQMVIFKGQQTVSSEDISNYMAILS